LITYSKDGLCKYWGICPLHSLSGRPAKVVALVDHSERESARLLKLFQAGGGSNRGWRLPLSLQSAINPRLGVEIGGAADAPLE
jgi:hypothetical protein